MKGLSVESEKDIRNRLVSMVHGASTFLASAYIVLCTEMGADSDSSFGSDLVYFYGLAYAIVDLLACAWYKLDHAGLYVHHGLMMCGMASVLLTGTGAYLGLVGYFVAEVTNVQMHLRCIVKAVGLRHTLLYEALEVAYLGPYVLFRGVYMSLRIVPLLLAARPHWLVKAMMVGLFLQSLFYITKMYAIAKRKIRQFREMATKGIWYFWLTVNPRLSELSFHRKQ